MDIHNLSNAPIEMDLAGKKYKISRLNLTELMCSYQKKAKEQYIENVQMMAKGIQDKNERLEFLSIQMRRLPQGEELEELASKNMETIDGAIDMMFTILNKHQEVNRESIMELFQNAENTEEINGIVSYATSQDAEKKIPKKKKYQKAQSE
jgi:hypothetical protein